MSTRPATPGTLSLGAALDGNESLGRLLRQLRESNDCFAAVKPLLPPGLAEQVRPGPLDDEGWSLLVPSGAVASKLRQLLPRLQEALRARGRPATVIRIRVQALDSR
jgi:hypothetical protein